MRTKEINSASEVSSALLKNKKSTLKSALTILSIMLFFSFSSQPTFAHCDSFDGSTIKDAIEALETNNVNLVLKWISPDQEAEVVPLFYKTYALKSSDKEVYNIVERHFLETLVRLHRETEGAAFTGLKAAGTTSAIVNLSDTALKDKDIDTLLAMLNNHIGSVLREKYNKVAALDNTKNDSPQKGREYVAAYVDYTHSVEAVHDILLGGAVHNH